MYSQAHFHVHPEWERESAVIDGVHETIGM